MEVKDWEGTVLSDEQIINVLLSVPTEGQEYFAHNIAIGDPERALVKKQAQISFKAGKQEGRREER